MKNLKKLTRKEQITILGSGNLYCTQEQKERCEAISTPSMPCNLTSSCKCLCTPVIPEQ
jgi:hypothetical protein